MSASRLSDEEQLALLDLFSVCNQALLDPTDRPGTDAARTNVIHRIRRSTANAAAVFSKGRTIGRGEPSHG